MATLSSLRQGYGGGPNLSLSLSSYVRLEGVTVAAALQSFCGIAIFDTGRQEESGLQELLEGPSPQPNSVRN